MWRSRWLLGSVGWLLVAASPLVAGAEDGRFAAADVTTPSPLGALPSPLRSPSGDDLRSPGAAPLLPPAGLPTAPPPDAIKPVVPQAAPGAPKPDPVAAEVAETATDAAEASFRYLAVLSGACDGLTVADHAVPECASKLVNVDFGNGRVAFLFTGREGDKNVVTTFSGGKSKQTERRGYRLAVDRVSTTTVDANGLPVTVVSSVDGDCTMKGDPTREHTRFTCRVTHAGKDTTASFESTGKPEVYAGTAGDDVPEGRPADRRDYADGFTNLAARNPFPRVITQ